jgi:hypothetical protein
VQENRILRSLIFQPDREGRNTTKGSDEKKSKRDGDGSRMIKMIKIQDTNEEEVNINTCS